MNEEEKLKRWRILTDTLYRAAAEMQLKGIAYVDDVGKEFHSDLVRLCNRAEETVDAVEWQAYTKV